MIIHLSLICILYTALGKRVGAFYYDTFFLITMAEIAYELEDNVTLLHSFILTLYHNFIYVFSYFHHYVLVIYNSSAT